ncbi:MAG: hypothetical protein LBB61_02305 [Treponema sp.]|jgi:hypothetical protein|nr:hypothetical protein [Treponema sp.]
MADLASGVSSEGTPKTGGAADEGAGIEGSKEEAGGGHDGLRTFTARGGEPAVMLELWRAFSEDGEAGHVCDALMTARTNRKPKRGILFHYSTA